MSLFGGLALFCTGLTLDTYVTGALNPVRRARLRAEEGNDGNRNSPKRREIPYCRRSSHDHASVEDDCLSTGALGRTGGYTGWSFFPGSGTSGQSVPARCFRRHGLITSAGCVAGDRNPSRHRGHQSRRGGGSSGSVSVSAASVGTGQWSIPGRLVDCVSDHRSRSLSNCLASGVCPASRVWVSVMACPSAVVPRRVVA